MFGTKKRSCIVACARPECQVWTMLSPVPAFEFGESVPASNSMTLHKCIQRQSEDKQWGCTSGDIRNLLADYGITAFWEPFKAHSEEPAAALEDCATLAKPAKHGPQPCRFSLLPLKQKMRTSALQPPRNTSSIFLRTNEGSQQRTGSKTLNIMFTSFPGKSTMYMRGAWTCQKSRIAQERTNDHIPKAPKQSVTWQYPNSQSHGSGRGILISLTFHIGRIPPRGPHPPHTTGVLYSLLGWSGAGLWPVGSSWGARLIPLKASKAPRSAKLGKPEKALRGAWSATELEAASRSPQAVIPL